jgi:hypothetical protein
MTVSGTITDNIFHAPVPDVRVDLQIYTSDGFLRGGHYETIASFCYTDSSGTYSLSTSVNPKELPDYQLIFTYGFGTQTIPLNEEENVRLDIVTTGGAALWLSVATDTPVQANETLAVAFGAGTGYGMFTITPDLGYQNDVRKLLVAGDCQQTVRWQYKRHGVAYADSDSVYCAKDVKTDYVIKF